MHGSNPILWIRVIGWVVEGGNLLNYWRNSQRFESSIIRRRIIILFKLIKIKSNNYFFIYGSNIFFIINFKCKIYRSWFSYNSVVGAGAGIGIVFAGLLIAIARNPGKEARLMQIVLLGFALTEAMGLLAIMVAFLILYS